MRSSVGSAAGRVANLSTTISGSFSPRKLRLTNLGLGFLHVAQGIAILVLGSGVSAPITASFIGSATQYTYEPRILIAIFLFVSAVDHVLLSSPKVFSWYIHNLRRHINVARWYEYAISASLMVVLIASLTGITDLVALVSLFAVTAAMSFFGLMMELQNQTTMRTDWTAFVFGSIVGIVPWVMIFLYFVKATPSPPPFVYGIVVSLLVLYALFPLNMWLQYAKKGRWTSYVWGEYGYMFLSLVAKSALAWQVFGGTLNSTALYPG